jgi:hypothetical protein
VTPAQKARIQQYIRTHPQVLVKHKAKTKRKVRRRVRHKKRLTKRQKRRRAAKRRKAKTRAKAHKRKHKRKARRGAVAAKRGKNKKSKKKKAGSSSGRSLIDYVAILFLLALPFIAVALLLFGTDYRRRPRAPSNKKRRGVLVVTPVGRKY